MDQLSPPIPLWTDVWQAIGTIAGVLVSLIGFIFLIIQLRQNRESIEDQTHRAIALY